MAEALRWRFALRIGRDNVPDLRWSYTTDRLRRRRSPAPGRAVTVRVEMWTRDGERLLSREDIPGGPKIGGDPNEVRALGDVAFHPDTGAIRLSRDGVLLTELRVPTVKPTVRLKQRRIEKSRQQLEWETTSEDTGQRWYSVFIELDDGRRYPIGRRTTDPQYIFDASHLPGCRRGKIVVRVSDGVWTAEDETEPVSIPAKPPTLWILSPRGGAPVHRGQPLQLSGQGWDVQQQRQLPSDRLRWSIDGKEVGHGRLLVAPSLGRGTHVIDLTAGEDEAGKSRSQVEVEVM